MQHFCIAASVIRTTENIITKKYVSDKNFINYSLYNYLYEKQLYRFKKI